MFQSCLHDREADYVCRQGAVATPVCLERRGPLRLMFLHLSAASAVSAVFATAAVAAPPPIRISASNQVPACVTPERLMRFLATRNSKPLARFRKIAEWYKYHGEAWRVRWDYAFYQMAIETNFLTYRAPSGRMGDVDPKQNNFAGIGTTGGGVPGNSFPDVSTGVLAQIQHLVVYSGERIANPVAPRTELKQDVILKLSRPVAEKRPVTFQDLSGRWAVDRRYGRSIEYVAQLFRKRFCNGDDERVAGRGGASAKAQTASLTRSAPALPDNPRECRVQVASYGGSKTLLIQSVQADTVQFTALDVFPAFESEMAEKFAKSHAPGGATIATFGDRQAALSKAHALCKRLTSVQ